MGTHYTHLSHFERGLMFTWYHYEKHSIRKIARRLKRSPSTISREIRRNKSRYHVPTWYPNIAQNTYRLRVINRGRRYRLKNPETRSYVIEKLKIGWSPEVISGRTKLEGELTPVSHESIYQYIYKEAPELIELLPRHHKKRRRKYPKRKQPTKFQQKTMISDRPEAINNRSEYGHWECDSIVSPKQKPGCNVLVERKSRLVKIVKLSSKTAQVTLNAILKSLSPLPSEFIKSITYDNGSENTKHELANDQLNCDSYFCEPYHSWEKGAVEQVNSLIRRFIPKKIDISTVSESAIKEIESLLNNRPRKCLGYKTPLEVFEELHPEAAV